MQETRKMGVEEKRRGRSLTLFFNLFFFFRWLPRSPPPPLKSSIDTMGKTRQVRFQPPKLCHILSHFGELIIPKSKHNRTITYWNSAIKPPSAKLLTPKQFSFFLRQTGNWFSAHSSFAYTPMAVPTECPMSSASCLRWMILYASLTMLWRIMVELTRFPVRLNVCSRNFV